MLVAFKLQDFKSYGEASLPLGALTVLIGANAAGKSNAIEALRLLSTHNPALLDALPASALNDVVFCYRDPMIGNSRLVRLSELPDVPELLVQGSLGHLMTSGLLDRFVKNHKGPAERKQKAKAWLASLRVAEPGIDG
jgi:hypothetical protein